jgi:hypothetical protein
MWLKFNPYVSFFHSLIPSLLFPLITWADVINLHPISGSASNNRWMDIADNLYSPTYQDVFTYALPIVTVSYDNTSDTFTGTLTAIGLKPNFAYQMKLVGNSYTDDWTNEHLGFAGRWWRVQPDPGNSNDTDYDIHKDDPDYIYQGYLFFDYFLTDQQGNATVNFSANSSYHVLWASNDSTGVGTGHKIPGVNDSAIVYSDFTASPAINSDAYSTDYGNAHVGVFAEWESGRALPAQLSLTPGEYHCSLVLTEESFHQSGLGGGWASVLEGDINFTIFPDGDLAPFDDPDGFINAADLLIASQLTLGQREAGALQYAHGDMNRDDVINVVDLLLIRQIVLHD